MSLALLCEQGCARGMVMTVHLSSSSPPPLPSAIFLVGFMGCGKTTVGRLLAQRMAWKFIDLDAVIEEEESASIADIFARHSEAAFRRREHEILRRMVRQAVQQTVQQAGAGAGRVIALGGGTFAQPANLELLQRAGAATVWVECPIDELLMRCALMANRPLFRDEASFRRLYEERLPFYQQATYSVRSGRSDPRDVVQQILALPVFQGRQWLNAAEDSAAPSSAAPPATA